MSVGGGEGMWWERGGKVSETVVRCEVSVKKCKKSCQVSVGKGVG